MTKNNSQGQSNAATSDAQFTVDTSVTRQALIEQYFSDAQDPEKDFDATLTAMGLKAGGKKFKAQTAYFISECRKWMQSGEIESYEKLTEHWKTAKDAIASNFTKMQSSLTQADGNGNMTAGQAQNAFTDANPAMALAEPAQNSYEAGLSIVQQASERIAHNQNLVGQVIDAAFFEGLKDGAAQLSEQAKKQPNQPLITEDQARSLLTNLKRNSSQPTN